MAAMLSELYNYEIDFRLVNYWPTHCLYIITNLLVYFDLHMLSLNDKLDNNTNMIKNDMIKLGKITNDEIMVGIVFFITACLWISRRWLSELIENILPGSSLNDSSIAIAAALILFLLPSYKKNKSRLINWEVVQNIPWGALILIGGGLSLASVINSSD